MSPPGPPPIFEAVLAGLLPPRNRSAILGDLAEEWTRRRDADGLRTANRWYRLEVVRSLGPALLRRIASLRGGGSRDPASRISGSRISPGGAPAGAGLLRDLRHGLRGLRRSPGFATIVVLTIGGGIGVATAVFSVVDGVLLESLPYPDPGRLHLLWQERADGTSAWVSGPDYVDWRENLETFSGVVAMTPDGFNVAGDGEPLRVDALEVTPGFFGVLGVTPAAGRSFRTDEGGPDARRVVVLGHGLWRRRYGGDPGAVGKTLLLDGTAHTIVGVAPPDLRLPVSADLFVPLPLFSEEWQRRRGLDWLLVLGRTRPDVPRERVEQDLSAVAAGLGERFPETNAGEGIALQSLEEALLGSIRTPLLVLLGAVLLLLALVSANVAILLTARATRRREEVAVRRALGGSRIGLARQFLVESLVLAVPGGMLGILLAYGATGVLVALAPADIPRLDAVAVDGEVLVFAVVSTALAGVVFGMAPAVMAVRDGLSSGLRAAGRGGTVRTGLRSGLVGVQVALSLVLLSGSGLLVESLRNLRAVDPGFDPAGVLTARLPLTESRHDGEASLVSFYRDLLDRLEARPGVRRAGLVDALPLAGAGIRFSYELREGPADPGEELVARFHAVSAGYFEAMGIELHRGRAFRDGEAMRDLPVVIVDAAFARRHFPDRDPVGREVRILGEWRRIVGVVESVRETDLAGEPVRTIYAGYGQRPRETMSVVLRSDGEAAALGGILRRVLRELAPDEPVVAVRPMEAHLSATLARPRFIATLVSVFAVSALLLASLGIYGLLAFVVRRRTREIGVRMALGARSARVRALVVRQAGLPTAAGLAVGIGLTAVLARYLRSLLFGVRPLEPAVLATVTLVLVAVIVAASWIPARRATRVDPARALRAE